MQKLVKDFIIEYKLNTDAKMRYIDLISEIGELGKEMVVNTEYGKKDLEINDGMADEIGDCLFSMLALCCELGIDAENALNMALSKYKNRFAKKGAVGSDG
jgi:uncharacterized protein YabN with tetrapyrrole methylase and pyrophosphatase domain